MTSNNLGINCTSDVFPHPVLPIIAVVSPLFAVNEISESASSSAFAYEKDTFSNETTPSVFGAKCFGCFGSSMITSVFYTSSIRVAATAPLGIIIETIVIIKKLITICIV